MSFSVHSLAPAEVKLQRHCVVFANACHSASPEPQFGDFTSFAQEFYRKGARVFIGTLAAVPTDAALQFAQRFYDVLFTGNGASVVHAYACARRSKGDAGATDLLYCFFGNPLVGTRVSAYSGETVNVA